MKEILVMLLGLATIGCSGSGAALSTDQRLSNADGNEQQVQSTAFPANNPEIELENFGPAPELNNAVWLNTDQPLRLADLKGKVVLLDMWTFG